MTYCHGLLVPEKKTAGVNIDACESILYASIKSHLIFFSMLVKYSLLRCFLYARRLRPCTRCVALLCTFSRALVLNHLWSNCLNAILHQKWPRENSVFGKKTCHVQDKLLAPELVLRSEGVIGDKEISPFLLIDFDKKIKKLM